VVEILNKRRGSFSKEDEEFLAEVGTHAALAVAGDRQYEAAVEMARREGAARALRGASALLVPHSWPETPGFETGPLRWGSDELNLVAFAVDAAPGRVGFLLLEPSGEPEDSLAAVLRSLEAGRRLLPEATPEEIVAAIDVLGTGCAVSAARWEGDQALVASGGGAAMPALFRAGRPLPAGSPGNRGDLLVVASTGLGRLRPTPASPLERFAWLAGGQPLPAAFARLVADFKREGVTPGDRDVLLLAARRA
jgi:hypothetical protein